MNIHLYYIIIVYTQHIANKEFPCLRILIPKHLKWNIYSHISKREETNETRNTKHDVWNEWIWEDNVKLLEKYMQIIIIREKLRERLQMISRFNLVIWVTFEWILRLIGEREIPFREKIIQNINNGIAIRVQKLTKKD